MSVARYLAVFLSFVGFSNAAADHHEMTPQTLSARIGQQQAPFILDVRTANEFAAGHVPGALNIPYDELPDRLRELPATTDEILVYCRSGRRAVIAEETLRANGYGNLWQLSGHWLNWSRQ